MPQSRISTEGDPVSTIKTTYEGIEIEYNEAANTWEFVLRGRHRSVPSLTSAKIMIDKEPAGKRKQEFPRQKALLKRYDSVVEVDVTSVAGYDKWSKAVSYWITQGGKREKRPDLLE